MDHDTVIMSGRLAQARFHPEDTTDPTQGLKPFFLDNKATLDPRALVTAMSVTLSNP